MFLYSPVLSANTHSSRNAVTLGDVAIAPLVALLFAKTLLSMNSLSFSLLGFLTKITEPTFPLLSLNMHVSMFAFEVPSRHMTPPSTSLLELLSKLDKLMSNVASASLALTYITPPSSSAFSPLLFLMSFLLKTDTVTLTYLELLPTYIADPLTAVFCSKSHDATADSN